MELNNSKISAVSMHSAMRKPFPFNISESQLRPQMGWQKSLFSDDALANRKAYPGHIFKHPKPGWADRCAVTERSMELHIAMLINDFTSKPLNTRRKISKKDTIGMQASYQPK